MKFTKLINGSIISFILLTGCGNSDRSDNTQKEISMQSTVENKKTVRKLYEECLNKRNFELLEGIIDKNYSGIRGESGPSGFAQTTQPIIEAFPDIQWIVEELIAEDNKVVIRWTTHGTHKGTFRGIFPATQKQIQDHAIVIYHLKDNKIIKAQMEVDRLGFLQQIGAIPEDLRLLAPDRNK